MGFAELLVAGLDTLGSLSQTILLKLGEKVTIQRFYYVIFKFYSHLIIAIKYSRNLKENDI